MKGPKDIFFLDLDRNGEWKVVNENELRKAYFQFSFRQVFFNQEIMQLYQHAVA
jgi:hypothetical protein